MEVSKTSRKHKALLLALLVLLVLATLSTFPRYSALLKPRPVAEQVPATTATVSISPDHVNDSNVKPGTPLIYYVNVTNSPAISGFNVWVRFDPRVLMANSSSIDYSKNLLGSGTTVQSECVNSVSIAGCSDPLLDLPGVVNLGLAYLGNKTTPAITTGLLYRLTVWVLDPSKEPTDPRATQLQIAKAILANGLIGEHGETYNAFTSDSFFTNRLCPTGSQPNRLCTHPFANFTWAPVQPSIGTAVLFNSTASKITNPSATLSNYTWFWGELNPCGAVASQLTTHNNTITHIFCQAVLYDVTLLVNDTLGISWAVTKTLQVIYVFVDVTVSGLVADPFENVIAGTVVHITASVINNSTLPAAANITVSIDTVPPKVWNKTFASLNPRGLPGRPNTGQLGPVAWDTSGLPIRAYRINMVVTSNTPQNITSDKTTSRFVLLITPQQAGLLSLNLLESSGLGILVLIGLVAGLARLRKKPSWQTEPLTPE